MFKNNVFAILTHFLCILFTFLIAIIVKNYVLGAILFSVFMWGIYVFVGIKLKPQNSIVHNLLSVSFVVILGLILWLLGLGKSSISSFFWEIHFLYITPISIVILMLPKSFMKLISNNSLFSFIITLIPTILMWVGLQLKTRRLKQHNL